VTTSSREISFDTFIVSTRWLQPSAHEMESLAYSRARLAVPRLRFTMNLIGSSALGPKEFAKPRSMVGASITVNASTELYDAARLINLIKFSIAKEPL
jgi:hypothetical protein